MIRAKHKFWADAFFNPYLNGLMKRHFYALYLQGPVPVFDMDKPVLILPNHSSWWDGFFIYVLNRRLFHRQIYLMMLEDQLKRNRFFQFLGAYSMDPDRTSEIRQSLIYTMDLLDRTADPPLVCMFPQGELLSWHSGPVTIQPGLEFLLNRVSREINLCFLGIRIEMLDQQRPEAFFRFSPVQKFASGQLVSHEALKDIFDKVLENLRTDLAAGKKGRLLFQGMRSINDRLRIEKHRESMPG